MTVMEQFPLDQSSTDQSSTPAADREIDPELKEILLSAVDPDPDRRHADYPACRSISALMKLIARSTTPVV